MRLKKNIQETLKASLFVSPNPPRYKSEYLVLRDEIFPSKNLFIEFLEAENYEEQLSIANEILLCLNYNSIFSPPTKLLYNLLSMESLTSTRDNDSKYANRDHVVHQVHLYIFGVYVFFYHEVFAENIISSFRYLRRREGENANTSMVISDFIQAWRAFVLFHDVGYPIEKFAGDNNLTDNECYLSTFLQIPKFIGKDISMRCISKIIAVSKLIDHDKYCQDGVYTFGELNKIVYHDCKTIKNNVKIDLGDKTCELLDEIKEYILINKVYGIKTIQTVISIYGRENIFAALYNKEEILYMLFLPNGEIVVTKKCPKNNTIMELAKNINSPYEHNTSQNSNLVWRYYIKKESTDINKIVKELFQLGKSKKISLRKNEEHEVFSNIVNKVYEQTSANYANVISDSSFNQYCFDVYYALYNILGYNKQQREDVKDPYIYHLDESIQNFSINVTEEMTSALRKYFKDNEKKFEGKGVEDVIKGFMESVKNESERIVESIKESIESNIKEQCKFKAYFEILRSSIGEKISESKIGFKVYFKKNGDIVDYRTLEYPIINDSSNKIIANLSNKLRKNNISLNELIKDYKLPYANNRVLYDHGIFGSVFSIAMADFYQNLYKMKSESQLYPFKQIMNIALGMDYDISERSILYFFYNTLAEALYAILIHNIYPSQLSNKSFKTALEPNPFAYFSTLLDSLQFWNRDSRINQAEYVIPYTTYSKSLNIEIRDNKIRITEADCRLDINQTVKRRRDSLDDFLEEASGYIELSLSDF